MADRERTATDGNAGDDTHAGQWPLERLVDYIVHTHHRYVRDALPVIAEKLEGLRFMQRDSHPELARVAHAFGAMSRELERHLQKEEQILFPYVCQLTRLDAPSRAGWTSPFGTVANPIAMMEREHREAFDALGQIRLLTDGYAVPADGGADYAACMAALAEFEADLERHVQLENTVLFPRALALEERTVGS